MRCKWPLEPSDPKDRVEKNKQNVFGLATIMGWIHYIPPKPTKLYIEIGWFNGCVPNLQNYIYIEIIRFLNARFVVFTPCFAQAPKKKTAPIPTNSITSSLPPGIPYIHRSCVLMTRQAIEHGFFRMITWICFEYLVPQSPPWKYTLPKT